MPEKSSRSRLPLAVAACVAVALLVLASSESSGKLETAASVDGSEAQSVTLELQRRFRSPLVERVLLVVTGLPPADSPDGLRELTSISEILRAQREVSEVVSYASWRDPLFLGSDGGTVVIIGLSPDAGAPERVIPRLRGVIASLQRSVRESHPRATFRLTGETPLNFDVRKASSDDARLAEMRVLPVLLILLLLAFGSVVAALLPIAVGFLAIASALGAAAIMSEYWHLSILVQNLATMLGLGLGIDYALLMVSRFREGLADGLSPSSAVDVAASRGGHTLLVSASTVAIGFAALVTVPISDIRSIGVAGFLVAGACLSLSVTLVPAALQLLGKRVNMGTWQPAQSGGSKSKSVERWRRRAIIVTSHPLKALTAAAAPLVILAIFAFRLSLGLPREDWLPPAAESVVALHDLAKMGRAGIVQSLRVVVELPPGNDLRSDEGWKAVDRVTRAFAGDRRTDRVISLSTFAAGPAVLPLLPDPIRRSFMSADGRAMLLEVLPRPDVSPMDQTTWVAEIRRGDPARIVGLRGSTIRVGGIPALNADYTETVSAHFASVMGFVIAGTLVVLLAAFRSLLAALKAIALNLLSVAAAIGLLVIVFQNGYGSRCFGIAAATGSIFPIVPILTFAVVFGLSMDYEVFLVGRILEYRRSGLSEQDAIAEGVAMTAGLITSAAAIMIAVFAAFAFGSFLIIQMIGFTLAAAVLIDATLVRLVIGPALLALGGRWNWWPAGLRGSAAHPAA